MNSPWSKLPGNAFTRVVALDQRSPRLRCRSHVISLEENNARAPTYEAISYVWGAKNDTLLVYCNEVEVSVPRSLAQALTVIWHYRPTVKIWADAISIDQRDEQEKEHQIMMMDLIFHRAERVHLWLGTNFNHCDLIWSLLRWYLSRELVGASAERDHRHPQLVIVEGEVLQQSSRNANVTGYFIGDASKPSTSFEVSTKAEHFEATMKGSTSDTQSYYLFADDSHPEKTLALDDEARSSIISSIVGICNSKWFTRIWTLQEMLLAKSALMWTGNSAISWPRFREFMIDMDVCFDDVEEILADCYPVFLLPDDPNFIFLQNSPSALWAAIFRASTEPRDMFYAVQGLLSNPLRCKVRYNTSISSVYIYGTRMLLSVRSGSSALYQLLQHAGLSMRRHPPNDPLDRYHHCNSLLNESQLLDESHLPSWVPNYACEPCMKFPQLHNALISRGWTPQVTPHELQLVCNGKNGRLEIEGSFIGYLGESVEYKFGFYPRDRYLTFHNMPRCIRSDRYLNTYPGRYPSLRASHLTTMYTAIQTHTSKSCICAAESQQFAHIITEVPPTVPISLPHHVPQKPNPYDRIQGSKRLKLSYLACLGSNGTYRPARGWTTAALPGDWVFELDASLWQQSGLMVLRPANDAPSSQPANGAVDKKCEFVLVETDQSYQGDALAFGNVVHQHGGSIKTKVNQCPLAASGAHVNCSVTLL